MNQILLLLLLFTCGNACNKKDTMPSSPTYSYLALGDSYTIGEMVAPAENFPNQAVTIMKIEGYNFKPARIIAKTGWTTDELENGITAANAIEPILTNYDFVTLLIGVNNQYRGRSVASYRTEFEALLKKAIIYAGNRASRVVVLSIPDWGVTPFASGRDRALIAAEIDAYNAAKKQISFFYNVHYLDITSWTREAATDISLLASDGLHPSGKEYKRWAEQLKIFFKTKI